MPRETKLQKEYFNVYYDIEESLHEMIEEEIDPIYKKKPRSKQNLDEMKKIKEKVVEAVAAIKGVSSMEIQDELEAIRRG